MNQALSSNSFLNVFLSKVEDQLYRSYFSHLFDALIKAMPIPYSYNLDLIEKYIESAPEEWQHLIGEVHNFILASSTQITPWFKYRLPFYGIKRNICFLNLKADRTALDIGFMYGPVLELHYPETRKFLSSKELKMVRHYKLCKNFWGETEQEELSYVLERAIEMSLKS